MSPIERFEALTKRQQDEILDKYRDWNVYEDWHDYVYEDFKRDMDAIGIEVDKMYFSGFSSQGDGACFEGRVGDWPKFLESAGYTCPALIGLAAESWGLSVVHRGHYYHENCTSFTSDMVSPDDYSESEMDEFVYAHSPYKTDIQNAAFVAILKGYNFGSLETEFTEEFKRHMRDLYNRLEVEYDALTSDESVLEALHANDMLDEIIDELENEYA
jgi:arginyl-tRNA synthetase